MTNEKWVSIKDMLPKINTKCSVGNEQDGVITCIGEGILVSAYFYEQQTHGFRWIPFSQGITHWRYPVEKKPDFDKLKKGDSIIAETISGISRIGFIERITSHGYIVTNSDSIGNAYVSMFECSDVKKITRINLEKQTFEEI